MAYLIIICNETHRNARVPLETDGTTWWARTTDVPHWANLVSANFAAHQAAHDGEDTYVDHHCGVSYHVRVCTGSTMWRRAARH